MFAGVLKGLLQGSDYVICVYSCTPGNVVGVDNTLAVKKGEDHLSAAAKDDFGHNGAWCASFESLLGLQLSPWLVHRHIRLVLCDDLAQKVLPLS